MTIQELYELLQKDNVPETIDTETSTILEQVRAELEKRKDVRKEILEKLINRQNAAQVVLEAKDGMSPVGYKVFIYSIVRQLTGNWQIPPYEKAALLKEVKVWFNW